MESIWLENDKYGLGCIRKLLSFKNLLRTLDLLEIVSEVLFGGKQKHKCSNNILLGLYYYYKVKNHCDRL